ncbi:MAG: ABC transporter permease [Verrucomicrobiota bacterium]|nr:ABC transporter permease [Verrucomicrobiota bacterium]
MKVKTPILLLLFLIAFALLTPLFTTSSPYALHLEAKNLPPSAQFFFGTDELGRDLLSRTAMGLRLSLSIALFAAIIDLIIGVLWGTIAAWIGGVIEESMMRLADILQAIPHLLIVIFLTLFWGSGFPALLLAIGMTSWIHTARITRGHLVRIRTLDYMQSARVIGASTFYIIYRYLIPNAIGPILASITLTLPSAIFSEAFLSFLGLGIQAPSASLGVMVNDGLSAMRYYPWRLWIPAGALSLLLLLLHSIGRLLQETIDPKLRK